MRGNRLLRVPREPSAAGMIVVSGLAGLVVALPVPSPILLLPLAAILLHFFTFDAAFDALRSRATRLLVSVVALNSAPYVVGAALYPSQVLPVIVIGLGIIGLHLYTARRLGLKSPATYITGALVPVLPALTSPALVGGLGTTTLVFWALLSIYSAATAAYVESKLAFRRYSREKPLVLWLPALLGIVACPYTAVALAEPTVKLVANLRDNKLVSAPKEIKRLGLRELIRLFVFVAVLVPILVFCRHGSH